MSQTRKNKKTSASRGTRRADYPARVLERKKQVYRTAFAKRSEEYEKESLENDMRKEKP